MRIDRHDPKQRTKPAVQVKEYKIAKLNIRYPKDRLHEVSSGTMAGWIKEVVDIESPVHKDEVIRRIVNAAGIKRVGRRIRSTFEIGLSAASKAKDVTQRGDFIWMIGMQEPKIRSRHNLPNQSRSISLIAPEEISSAILEVTKSTYGIQRDMIPGEVSNLFGFKRVTQDMNDLINKLVGDLISDNKLIDKGVYLTLPED